MKPRPFAQARNVIGAKGPIQGSRSEGEVRGAHRDEEPAGFCVEQDHVAVLLISPLESRRDELSLKSNQSNLAEVVLV